MRLDEASNGPVWQRCLRWTIKDGMVFDPVELLADVEAIAAASKATPTSLT
jgi:imidazolonepropionase